MTGARFTVDIDDKAAKAALARAAAFAEDLTPAMDDIGSMLVASTIRRFETGEAPDGAIWPPSLRAIEESGQTLVDSGRLRTSLTHAAGRDEVTVGTNVMYAAVHQFGATIRAKAAPFLQFRVGGRWARKREVTIPPRPFLGVSEGDRGEITNILRDHIESRWGP